jgi:hypothetical protein
MFGPSLEVTSRVKAAAGLTLLPLPRNLKHWLLDMGSPLGSAPLNRRISQSVKSTDF